MSRALPPDFRVERATPASRVAGAVTPLVCLFLASFPFWADPGWMRDLNDVACYLIFAMMWNLLAGYGGMVSIGQQAFLGLGGYALLLLGDFFRINPFVAVPLAALGTALVAWLVSGLVFRLKGGYFAIGTWVIADTFRLSLANLSAVGGGSGTSLTALRGIERETRVATTFWMCLGSVLLTIALTYWLLRSRHGLSLLAIRDSETAAESQGVNVVATKRVVYVLSAFGSGLAGALYFLGNLRISPEAAFSVNWTAFSIFIVLIGGIGTIEGPIIGVVIFYGLNRLLSDYGTWYLVALGLVAVLMTLKFPRGLWGHASHEYDLHVFPIRRRLLGQPGQAGAR